MEVKTVLNSAIKVQDYITFHILNVDAETQYFTPSLKQLFKFRI